MSVLTGTPTSPPPAPSNEAKPGSEVSRTRSALDWLRRRRTTALIVFALMAAVLVVALTQDGVSNANRLDPENPGMEGSQALAEVLENEGVDVQVVRSAEALAQAQADQSTTVIVTSTQNLGPSTADRLLDDTAGATLVVVDADLGAVDAFDDLDAPSLDSLSEGRKADCDLATVSDLTLEVDTALTYPSDDGCFRKDGRAALIDAESAVFFGGGDALTNDQVLRADNAAIALRVLGQHERLIWYVPDFADVIPSESSNFASLIPRWIYPALWLSALTALALMIWRGRRLGPLATEPLPVVIKAIETTRSRGRLYRRAGDRGHAATALRQAARSRAAERLRLGKGASEADLIRDLARHLGRSETELTDLVGTHAPVPRSDRDLIMLANQLAEIDRKAPPS